jgi:hypothetical protein
MDNVHFPTDTPRASRSSCLHDSYEVGGLFLDLCPQTGETHWIDDDDDEVDPAVALARLFGSFDLVAALAGVGAPGSMVLAYRPDSRRGRAAMRALPRRRWIEAAPDLWIAHDGDRLLMAPANPVLAANLARDL